MVDKTVLEAVGVTHGGSSPLPGTYIIFFNMDSVNQNTVSNKLSQIIYSAELRTDLPALDLHGYRPYDIVEKIDQFLYSLILKKEPVGQIIYGGGTGVLRDAVLTELANHSLVVKVVEKAGYCIVVLANN